MCVPAATQKPYPSRPADGTEVDPGPERRDRKRAPAEPVARPPFDPGLGIVPSVEPFLDAWNKAGLKPTGRAFPQRKSWWAALFTSRPDWAAEWPQVVARLGKSRRAKGQDGSWAGLVVDSVLRDRDGLIDRILTGEFDDAPAAGRAAPPAEDLATMAARSAKAVADLYAYVPGKPLRFGKPAATGSPSRPRQIAPDRPKPYGEEGISLDQAIADLAQS